MRSQNFNRQLQFVRASVRQLDSRPSRTRVAVITFSDTARLDFGLSAYRNRRDIVRALRNVHQPAGASNTDSALLLATQELERNGRAGNEVTKLVVVVTDGPPDDVEMAATQALLLRRAGVHVLAIGVGAAVQKSDLIPLAGRETFALRVKSYRGLRALTKVFDTKACELEGDATTEDDRQQRADITKAEKGTWKESVRSAGRNVFVRVSVYTRCAPIDARNHIPVMHITARTQAIVHPIAFIRHIFHVVCLHCVNTQQVMIDLNAPPPPPCYPPTDMHAVRSPSLMVICARPSFLTRRLTCG